MGLLKPVLALGICSENNKLEKKLESLYLVKSTKNSGNGAMLCNSTFLWIIFAFKVDLFSHCQVPKVVF